MHRSTCILIILAVALLLGMVLTALFGRGSRHGYGMVMPCRAACASLEAPSLHEPFPE